MSGASERANGRASGPVLQSVLLAVIDHSEKGRRKEDRETENKRELRGEAGDNDSRKIHRRQNDKLVRAKNAAESARRRRDLPLPLTL